MKTLSASFKNKASGDANKPLEIYDVYLDETTLHLVNYDKNIDFYDIDGISRQYIAFPVSRETYERSVENQVNSLSIETANVDRSMSAYLASNEFRGRRIIVRKVFADGLTTSGDACIIFDGIMDSPAATEETIKINAVDRIGTLHREAPRRWFQLLCNWKFGDEQCFYGRTSGDMYNTQRYVCNAGCTRETISSASLTQANNYWKDGEIQITSGQNALKKRKINASSQTNNSVTLDYNLEYTPTNGDTFTVRRGCDKTHFRCSGDFLNDNAFGGFDTVPQQMVIR